MKEEKKLMLQETESERGATMVEYALVVALVATVCIVGFAQLGEGVKSGLAAAGKNIQDASQGSSKVVSKGISAMQMMIP